MVLGNYIIRDMISEIDDAFGGIGPILLPMSIKWSWNYHFDDWNYVSED